MQGIMDFWNQILTELESHLSVIAIASWFDEVTPIRQDADALLLYCPNDFKRDTILQFYREPLKKALRSSLCRDIDIRFLSHEELEQRQPLPSIDRFTFSSFVVGDCNRLAFSAAQAVAEGGTLYSNPLVLYGDSGTGKTHLLRAIAAAVREAGRDAVFLKGDEFTNRLIDAIRTGTTAQFRKKYRHAAVFLMDDVQFIAGKKQTQEEFFNTFESLSADGCSIVLAMDRPPCALQQLESRITGRFEGGLMVRLELPDYDTRMRLIDLKTKERNLSLPPQDTAFLAEHLTGSVRRLEGVLNRLSAAKQLGQPLSVEAAIRDTGIPDTSTPEPEELLRRTAAAFGTDTQQLRSKSRSRQTVLGRQTALFLLCELCGLSTTQAGELLSRDHSTVCHALQRVKEKAQTDPEYAALLDSLRHAANPSA